VSHFGQDSGRGAIEAVEIEMNLDSAALAARLQSFPAMRRCSFGLLLPFGGKVDSHGAEQSQHGKDRNEDGEVPARIERCEGIEGLEVKIGKLRLRQPVEPAKTMTRLADDRNRGNQNSDRHGKQVCAEDGSAYSFDGGAAAAKLGAPPDGSGSRKLGLCSRSGTGALEGLRDKEQIRAGMAVGQMRAKIRWAGVGPVAASQQIENFGLAGARTEIHGWLR
jgi:hypothetical protein